MKVKRCPFCGGNNFCADWTIGQFFWFDVNGISKEGEIDDSGDYTSIYCEDCKKEIPSKIWEKWGINLSPYLRAKR